MRINIALAALSWACCIATSHAQVGVGTTTPQAAFDVTSTTQGMLIPRVALTSRTVQAPVVNPQGGNVVTSTLIYNTATAGTAPNNVIPGFYYWNGTQWIAIAGSATPPASDAWLVTGNAGTSAATHFVGTTDDVDLVFRTNGNKKFTMASGTNQILAGASGAVSSPTYSWEASPNYGMYMASGTNIRVATAGVARFQFPNANQVHAMADGSGALPFYSWTNATGTGMFKTGNTTAAQLGFATNALERLRITQAGNVGVGTTTPATILEVAGALSLEEGTALALVNGVNNNVALGTTPYSLYRITGPTAQFSLTGIVPATAANGQLVTLENTTAHNMILVHQSGGSTAGNQFLIPGAENLTLKGQYATVTLQYNATQQKWIVKSYAGAAQQVNSREIYSVKGTTNASQYPTNTFIDFPEMTLTFTPKNSVVYVSFGASGDVEGSTVTNVSAGHNVGVRIVNVTAGDRIEGGTISLSTDYAWYDYTHYIATGWNIGMNMFPVTVTPGIPNTIKLQWRSNSTGSNHRTFNDVSTVPSFHHRNLTIMD
jgi:hypothetical protein